MNNNIEYEKIEKMKDSDENKLDGLDQLTSDLNCILDCKQKLIDILERNLEGDFSDQHLILCNATKKVEFIIAEKMLKVLKKWATGEE